MSDAKNSILEGIIQETKFEGYKEGTPEFERRRKQLHVIKCRELRSVSTCLECVYLDSCQLYADVKFDHEFNK